MKQKFLVLASAILVLVFSASGQAKLVEKVTKTGNEIVIPYEKYVLPNGLTLIVHAIHFLCDHLLRFRIPVVRKAPAV